MKSLRTESSQLLSLPRFVADHNLLFVLFWEGIVAEVVFSWLPNILISKKEPLFFQYSYSGLLPPR